MIYVNGEAFPVYLLDNEETIKERIAINMKTLPKYLYFPNGFNRQKESKNIVIDRLKTIINNSENFPLVDETEGLKEEDIIYPWLAFNESLENIPNDFKDAFLISMQRNEDDDFIEIYRKKIPDFKKKYQTDVRNLKEKVKEDVYILKTIENANISNTSTDFETLKSVFTLTLNNDNVTLMELFNYSVLTKNVPFCSIKEIYKIHKSFIPSEDWVNSESDAIIYKISPTKENLSREIKMEEYQEVIIYEKDDKIRINMMIDVQQDYISKEDYISRFFEIFNTNIDLSYTEKEDNIDGVFYLINQQFNKYVFADLVMNNNIFSYVFSINEGDKATKQKSGMHVYYDNDKENYVSFTLTEKYREITDSDEIVKKIPFNIPYLRVKITKSRNISVVENFMEVMKRIFSIYENLEPEIIKEYQEFIPYFGKKSKLKEVKERDRLKDIVPELFEKGKYARFCANLPRIVSEEEAKQINDYILFPKTPEEGSQHYYVCDHHQEHSYIGIRKNPNEKSNYKYVPCCYKIDQKQKETSLYSKYYQNKESDKEKIQQRVIKTNKFLTNAYGLLPRPIERIFETIDIDEDNIYYRYGFKRSNNSFITCILKAMNIKSKAKKERQDLINIIYQTGICSQELYNYTKEEIERILNDDKSYFDPKLFLRVLESVYNCNIILFDDTNIILPNHTKSYLRYDNKLPTILVYENKGSESDMAEYPQCELIIRYNQNGINRSFSNNDKIIKDVWNIYEDIYDSYDYSSHNRKVFLPINENLIVGQYIDVYGKCRKLVLNMFDNKNIILHTPPIPPLKVPKVSVIEEKYPLNLAFNVIAELGTNVNNQIINEEKEIEELSFMLGNVDVHIHIEKNKLIENMPYIEKISPFPDNTSKLEYMEYTRKMSKYMIEYSMWLLSNYLHKNNKNDVKDEDIPDFVKEYMQIDKNFKYGKVSKKFNTKMGLMRNNKLIIEDMETLKRLVYTLRLMIRRRKNKILKYHQKIYMDDFFDDIKDFDIYPSQILILGEKSVKEWIIRPIVNYELTNKVLLDKDGTYFFKNKLIGEGIWLARNVNKLEDAIKMGKYWKDKGVVNEDGNGNEENNFTLYVYKSSKDIKPYRVGNKNDISIIGYKIPESSSENLVDRFTVIMKSS